MRHVVILWINGREASKSFDDKDDAIALYNALRTKFHEEGFHYVGTHRGFFLYLRDTDNAKGRITMVKVGGRTTFSRKS